MQIRPVAEARFSLDCDVAIVGAGAAGHVATLAASEQGASVIAFERDRVPSGSTGLSSGLVPAAGTRLQRDAGVVDSAGALARDIQRKARHQADDAVVRSLAESIGPTIDWLMDRHGIPFVLVDGFAYPGHGARRMHGPPLRTGQQLMDHLVRAAAEAGVDVVTQAAVQVLYHDGERIRGVRIERPDGSGEDIGCRALVLCCCGYGGNRALVERYMPAAASAVFLGHAGNEGHAVIWGEQLGAELADMTAFQGHGSVAVPHNIGITWAIMMSGGIQVNALGERFANEHRGYSEQALDVLRQPGAIAFDVYDRRCHEVAVGFDHYRHAVAAGAIRIADGIASLEAQCALPSGSLARTLAAVAAYRAGAEDPLGRDFTSLPPLEPPYHAIKVTGGLYHTQGGLAVDPVGRVKRARGGCFPNLFAAGGAARGVSGPADWGYLAGNGLLSALALGRLAGVAAAREAMGVAAPPEAPRWA